MAGLTTAASSEWEASTGEFLLCTGGAPGLSIFVLNLEMSSWIILTVIKVIKHRINVNQFLTKEALEEMIKRGAAYKKIMTDLDV